MSKLIISGLMLGFTHTAFAAIGAVNVTNTDNATTVNYLEDSSGTRLTAASSAFYVGVMDEGQIAGSTSIANLFSHFTVFDPITTPGGDNPIVLADGFIGGVAQADYAPFDGQSIYIFAINDTTAADATEALIWRFTGTFQDDLLSPTGPSTDIAMISANGTAIFGLDAAIHNPYQLQAISAVPEPSSTALLGLGSVALLLRRRR